MQISRLSEGSLVLDGENIRPHIRENKQPASWKRAI